MNNARDTFEELRGRIDGSDPFMTGGHQIVKIRRGLPKQTPEWVYSNKTIQKFLLRSFPKLHSNDKQRRRAAIWARVINLYFRAGWTRGDIASELNLGVGTVHSAIRNIKRAAAGFRADGRGPLGRPKGRPKKHALPQTSLGGNSQGT